MLLISSLCYVFIVLPISNIYAADVTEWLYLR